MARPSANWTGLTQLPEGSESHELVSRVLATANFQYLYTRALEIRQRFQLNLPPKLTCTANTAAFALGQYNVVIEISFSDDTYWIARIPYRIVDRAAKTSMLSEVATMKIVRSRTTIPVPRIFDFEASPNAPFGFPYILMEYLGGRTLPERMTLSVPPEHRPKVANQLANVFNELQNLQYPCIGRLWQGERADGPEQIIEMEWHTTPGPLHTSLEYFYHEIQVKAQEMMSLHPDNADWATASWMLKATLPYIILNDRVHGPFPLCHLDFHYGNLLFDDEYNLTAVLDWSNAQAAPLEQLAACPEFITYPGISAEENQRIIDFKLLITKFVEEMEEGGEVEATLPSQDRRKNKLQRNSSYTPLSAFMATRSAEITLRQYMASPPRGLWFGKLIAKLLYNETITWEQLREAFGNMLLPQIHSPENKEAKRAK